MICLVFRVPEWFFVVALACAYKNLSTIRDMFLSLARSKRVCKLFYCWRQLAVIKRITMTMRRLPVLPLLPHCIAWLETH